MNLSNFINFKFLSSIYLKIKERELNLLYKKIQELQRQIESEKIQLKKDTQYLDKVMEQNTIIKKNYENLLNLFQNENKTFWIHNSDYNISPWENVYIKKKAPNYIIETKREQAIYVFDASMNDFLDYLSTLNCSIIVLSVDKSRIVLQLRIL